MPRHQVLESVKTLESAKDVLPPSYSSFQGLSQSSIQKTVVSQQMACRDLMGEAYSKSGMGGKNSRNYSSLPCQRDQINFFKKIWSCTPPCQVSQFRNWNCKLDIVALPSQRCLFCCVEELKSILIIFGALQQLVKSANQIVIWSMSFFMSICLLYLKAAELSLD